jgi:hypothetical protein
MFTDCQATRKLAVHCSALFAPGANKHVQQQGRQSKHACSATVPAVLPNNNYAKASVHLQPSDKHASYHMDACNNAIRIEKSYHQ